MLFTAGVSFTALNFFLEKTTKNRFISLDSGESFIVVVTVAQDYECSHVASNLKSQVYLLADKSFDVIWY